MILNFFVLPDVLDGTIIPPSLVISNTLFLAVSLVPFPIAKAVSLFIWLYLPIAPKPTKFPFVLS